MDKRQAQTDGDIITALCSLPKIQSEDGQDYVQLYDVLETVRRYLGDCISRTEAIKTIQQHGVGCFDADEFTPEQCERYVIKLLQNLKPSVAIPSADPKCESCELNRQRFMQTLDVAFELGKGSAEPKWIPVSERLPEESTAVLVWCPERKNIYCAYYEEKQWWIFGAYFQKITLEVITWMPLPKPYKAESEERSE